MSLLPVLVACFLLLAFENAQAISPNASTESHKRLLELWVNGHTEYETVPVIIQGSRTLLIEAKDLIEAGIKLTPKENQPLVNLYDFSFITADVNEREQRLSLDVSIDHLSPKQFDLDIPVSPAPMPSNIQNSNTGFLGDYDLLTTTDNVEDLGETARLEGALGGILFTPDGFARATGFGTLGSSNSQFIRLDTSFQMNHPENLSQMTFGDTISSSQWDGVRSVRFAGFQWANDFSLKPDLNTMPLPDFFGQTDVPANVDVFIGSNRIFEKDVKTGPFEFKNLPILTGYNEVTVVVKDVLGRERTMTIPFYANNNLLKEGLSAYSFDVGFLRKDYGLDSFNYGELTASGQYKEGLNKWLTLEQHTQLSNDVQVLGTGAAFSMGSFGTLNLSSTVSRGDNPFEGENFGALNSLSFQTQMKSFGLFGSINQTTGEYQDIASIDGQNGVPDFRVQLGSHFYLGDYGSLSGSFIRTDYANETTNLTTASYTVPIGKQYSLGATGFYDHSRGEAAAQAFFSVILGSNNDTIVTGNTNFTPHGHQEQFMVAKPTTGLQEDWGYRLTGTSGTMEMQELDTTWVTPKATFNADVSRYNNNIAPRLSASGGIVVMDDDVFFAKQDEGSIAVVHTGKSDIDIFHENRKVATTSDDGKALVTGLTPYTLNKLSIDPSSYNFSTIVEDTEKSVIPADKSGLIVDFTPSPRFPVLVSLQLSDRPVPLGATITLEGIAETLIVGHRGQLFIPDLQHDTKGEIKYEFDKVCTFEVKKPNLPDNKAIPRMTLSVCQNGATP